MFLTRLGFGSRMVVTGDITQVDLPAGQASGLRLVQDILEGVEDIHFARLTSHDVVRHRLVGDIVNAYERYEARTGMDGPGGTAAAGPGSGAATAGQARGDRASGPVTGPGDEHRDTPTSPGSSVDEAALAALARYVLDEMRIHPLAELSVLLVDEPTIDRPAPALDGRARPHRRAGLPHGRAAAAAARAATARTAPGPTGDSGRPVLGDVVLCPEVAAEQAREAQHPVTGRARAAVHPRHPAPARI